MCRRLVSAVLGIVILTGWLAMPVHAALNQLAYYHLGEADAGAAAGGAVATTVESLGLTPGVDMTPFLGSTDLKYSSDTPSSITSSLSIAFDSGQESLLSTATPWYTGTGGFRWGMEAFLKPDPSLAGVESIFFTNSGEFTMGMTAEGFFYVNATGPGTTPVKYGQWQHVAFITTGSVWQIYVDGVAQFAPLPNFNYNTPSGSATLGSNNFGDPETSYTGLMDEHRVFSWTGSFNPNELLWYQGRPAGDVNEDGLVNSADYNIWRANVGADLTSLTALEGRALGDLNGDRQINLADFGLIKSNKSPGASLGIPEPTAVALLLVGLAACGLRRRRLCARTYAALAIFGLSAALLPASTASAQAVWGGGNGNWNDANWTGGTGPGGRPDAGDSIVLPPTTGTLTVSSDIGLAFDKIEQQGGILDITPTGSLELTGALENGRGTAANGGEVRIAGELIIAGELDVAYDVPGTVRVLGSGVLNITGNMDTWWTGAAAVDLIGGSTNITVGATYFYGPGATINANINSASFAPIKVNTSLSIQGGTLNVNFTDGFTPTPGNSWTLFDAAERIGSIVNVNGAVNGNGLAPGTRLSVNYGAGGTLGQVVTIDYDTTLNLKVDASTGAITIENPAAGAALNIDGYIIRSASSALNPAGFSGVGAPDWLPGVAPSQSAKLISETNFNGSLSIAQGATYPLGSAFNGAGAQDLLFEFHLASGEVLLGTVQYVGTTGFAADFNGNGVVDGADLTLWKTGFGKATGAVKADGDFNHDGRVDGADFLGWQRQFGSGVAPVAAIPEPASLTLLATAALAAAASRKRHS